MRLCLFGLKLTHKGGVENLSVNLTKHLAENDCVDEILVACEDVDEDAFKLLNNRKVTLLVIGRPRGDLIRVAVKNNSYRQMSSELKKSDVFHTLDCRAFPLASIHPQVITIHDVMAHEFLKELKAIGLTGLRRVPTLFDHYGTQMFLELLAAKRADKIIVNNALVANRLKRLYGNIVADKIRIIPPGFDPEKFNPHLMTRSEAKKILKINPSSKIVLHIGGSKERKGLPLLLEAVSYMGKNGELDELNLSVLVLGKVSARHARLFPNLHGRLIELPYVPEDVLLIVYQAADVFVMPSTSEGWGIALIQALACGTPVIASQHVPSALANSNLNAVKIEYLPSNAKQFAQSIKVILSAFSSDMNWAEVFNSLVLNYSWQKIAQDHVQVYNELISSRSPHLPLDA